MPDKRGQVDGLLVIDKPAALTSRAMVDRVLRWFPRGTRAGHAGTLDPLATGVLVVCLGAATRLAEYVQRMKKTYRVGIRLGATSDTDDVEGSIHSNPEAARPSQDAVARELQGFLGEIEQVPPAFSAAKVQGQRAYQIARRGQTVPLLPRRVQIFHIRLLDYSYPGLEIEVLCGKGAYIRSLARDLGQRLGCGALVESLRRTSIGPFSVADTLSLEASSDAARSRLLPLARAVIELPSISLDDDTVMRLSQGQSVALAAGTVTELNAAHEIAVLRADKTLAAVAWIDDPRGALVSRKVFAAPVY